MSEDRKGFVERRLSPRIKMTVRRHIAYWVAMSPARRVVFSLGLAAVIGGTTFGACRASDLTGPNFKSQQPNGISRTLGGVADGSVVNDEDSNTWPVYPPTHNEMDSDAARADPKFESSIETTFPVTEAVYNTCVNEMPVMNGFLKTRIKTEVEGLEMKFKLTEFKDTRGVFATVDVYEPYDHDGNALTPMEMRVKKVKYHNKTKLLDKFVIEPPSLPFKSVFESRMFLQREEHDHEGHRDGDHHHEWKPGDDLFVLVRETMRVDRNGRVEAKSEFRTECK